MNYSQLVQQIGLKKSFLCVGLDTDYEKIPACVKQDKDWAEAIFTFNQQIIDSTALYAVAFKFNLAFYELYGHQGWCALEKTVSYIQCKYPEILVIADAKRGDIGHSSKMYARALFTTLGADAVTVPPYMGRDSIEPFLQYKDKWTIVLALTSNPGSGDFQQVYLANKGISLFEEVIQTAQHWDNGDDNNRNIERMMFVVGATHANAFANIRRIAPYHFLLVPGIGAQGGSLAEVAKYGINKHICGLLVNSSRSIIYAGAKEPYAAEEFAKAAAVAAADLQTEMAALLAKYCPHLGQE